MRWGKNVEHVFHEKEHKPETVSALILRELANAAEAETGEAVKDVVITVPAYFGVAERDATRKAGRIAGLNVLNVVPEPVAAALHYEAMGKGEDRTILVFDLGGGTFDTTVIKIVGHDIHVVCTDGNHRLGGADWDDKIADFLLERFCDENPGSAAADSEEFLQELALAAEDIKKALSADAVTPLPDAFRRSHLPRGADPYAVRGHGVRPPAADQGDHRAHHTDGQEQGAGTFDDVLLVGGSCRVPAVAAMLREEFGFEPKMHDPDQAVAKGAALFALIESVKVELPAEAEGGVRPEFSEAKVQEVAEKLGTTASKVRELAAKKVATVVPTSLRRQGPRPPRRRP